MLEFFKPSPVFSHRQVYGALSGVTSKNNFKILLTEDSVYTEHKKYKTNFLRNNVNEMSNVYTKNIIYEEIFIISNYLFGCLFLLILINN